MKILPDLRIWSLVIALTALSLIGSVTKYRPGKKGLPVVQERFPQVGEARWDQAGTYIESDAGKGIGYPCERTGSECTDPAGESGHVALKCHGDWAENGASTLK